MPCLAVGHKMFFRMRKQELVGPQLLRKEIEMKKILGVRFGTIGLILALSSPAMAVPIVEFGGGNISFDGGTIGTATTFTFSPAAVSIPTSSPLAGAPVTITGGPFTIGAAEGCAASCFDVLGSGTFKIDDSSGDNLTGSIDLVNIYQTNPNSGDTNFGALANVIVSSSTGLFANYAPGAIVTLHFNLRGGVNLNTLATVTNITDRLVGFGGVALPVPEASSLFLLGAGLLGLAAYGRKKIMNG